MFTIDRLSPTAVYAGLRNVVGMPAEPVDTGNPRLSSFVEAVDRMAHAQRLWLVSDASPASLEALCPGGMLFLFASLHRSRVERLSYRWVDCGRFWYYYDPWRQCFIRSSQHLYLSIEQLLASCDSEEVFLLRPGSPYIGDVLASMWFSHHADRIRVYDVPSPVQIAADTIEIQVSGRTGAMCRFHFSGPDFVRLPLHYLSTLDGLLVVRSICDIYAPPSLSGSLLYQIGKRVKELSVYPAAVFVCHVGLQRQVVRCSAEDLLPRLTLLSTVCSPWTIVLVRNGVV
jgi:hypothetical protein